VQAAIGFAPGLYRFAAFEGSFLCDLGSCQKREVSKWHGARSMAAPDHVGD
jgi:hypothetical protein